MSEPKKKKRKHYVRAVNPEVPKTPHVTSAPNNGYSESAETRKLKARLLR